MTRSDVPRLSSAVALSPQPWVDELCRELLAACVTPLVAFLGDSRPRSLFVGGSAALGEAIGWSDDLPDSEPGASAAPRKLLLSDLDLGVITARPTAASDRRRLSGLLQELAGPILARHGAHHFSAGTRACPLGLGIYETRARATQRPTLGLVDGAQRAVVLWGDPAGPASLGAPPPESIPSYEAWRLVGNRAVERLLAEFLPRPEGASEPTGRALRAVRLHSRAKMAAGLWTARLVLAGRYRVGWRARAALLEEAQLALPDDPLVRCAVSFRSFLESGSAAGLPPEESQRRLLAAALRLWLAESAPAETAPASAGSGPLPEVGFLGEPLAVRERYRLWKREEAQRKGASRALAAWRALVRALDPSGGTPEGRRFAAAALYWRLFGEVDPTPGGQSEASSWRAPGEAAAVWNAGCQRLLGEVLEAGPDLGRRLRERIDRGGPPVGRNV